ncbi:MAG: DUF1801 domain-containing protein [Myxococcales bacterium]|nr:DUF1801 domain-containing protein [Myxococcales bacterium]
MPSKPKTARHKSRADSSAAVDELMASLTHPHKDAIELLRELMLGVDGSVAEGVKWNAPSFRTTEYFATTNLRTKTGIGVVLHLGAKVRDLPANGLAIKDPSGLLKWLAKDRASLELADAADLKGKRGAIEKILRQWIRHL